MTQIVFTPEIVPSVKSQGTDVRKVILILLLLSTVTVIAYHLNQKLEANNKEAEKESEAKITAGEFKPNKIS